MSARLLLLPVAILSIAVAVATQSQLDGLQEAGPCNSLEQWGFFDDLPADLIQKICIERLKTKELLKFAVGCKKIRPIVCEIVLRRLFESTFTTKYEIPSLVNILAFLNKYDQQHSRMLIDRISSHRALCLLQHIQCSNLYVPNQEKILRTLILDIRAPFINDLPMMETILGNESSEPILQNIDPIESADVPQELLTIVKMFVDERRQQQQPLQAMDSISQEAAHLPDCMKELRPIYCQPYCCVRRHRSEVANRILECTAHVSHLKMPKVVLALRRNGISFKLEDYHRHVGLSPDTVVEIVPMLDLTSILNSALFMLASTTSDYKIALQILKLPFVERMIRERADSLVYKFCHLLRHHRDIPSDRIAGLAGIHYMPEIINSCTYDPHAYDQPLCQQKQHSFLGVALYYGRFDIAKIFLRVPNASLYSRDRSASNLSVLGHLLRQRYEDIELFNKLGTAPFISHLLSRKQLLAQNLKSVVRNRYSFCLRSLVRSRLYWKLPDDIRLEMLQVAKDLRHQDSTMLGILENATEPALLYILIQNMVLRLKLYHKVIIYNVFLLWNVLFLK